MRALLWEGPGMVKPAQVAEPILREVTDAIVRVDYASTCGTDLHAYRGVIAEFEPGTILGHEFVGIVEACGVGVKTVKVGQRVRAADCSACGHCVSCKRGIYSSCCSWQLFGFSGNQPRLDGALAEYVRVPSADLVLSDFPLDLDPRLGLLCADVLPTALDALKGCTCRSSQYLVVLGSGPIGTAIAYLARQTHHHIVMVEKSASRRQRAQALGFSVSENIEGLYGCADIAIDAIGGQKGLQLALQCVRAGGLVVAAGAQGASYAIDWHAACKQNITVQCLIGDPIANRKRVDQCIIDEPKLAEVLFSDHITLADIPRYYASLLQGTAFKALVRVGE